MKCVLFFAGVVLFQMISTANANKEHFMACAKELGISEEMIKEGMEKNKGRPEYRCLSACIMKKGGTLEAGNKINEAKMREVASKFFGDKVDAVVKAGNECAEQSKAIADECDFINAVNACIYQKLPDLPKSFRKP